MTTDGAACDGVVRTGLQTPKAKVWSLFQSVSGLYCMTSTSRVLLDE